VWVLYLEYCSGKLLRLVVNGLYAAGQSIEIYYGVDFCADNYVLYVYVWL
jgi:hypothetical protein